MKAKAIKKILAMLTAQKFGYITIRTEKMKFTLEVLYEDEYEVNPEDNTLRIGNSDGTHWIDCDHVITIEV